MEKMNKPMFRDLTADEIDVRVATVNEKGITLLLYKDARCDMNILDETVGPTNWQREHYECKGNLFCRVGINRNYKDDTKPAEWIWKSDCGTESNTEKEKGASSDSFKRSCTNWSLGRELYTAPLIWVPIDKVKTYTKNGKTAVSDTYYVEKIQIVDKKITAISIKNNRGERVFLKAPAKGEA